MICYFRESFKPSIKVKMEQQDRESMDFEEIVQKAVNVEAKAGLRSSTMVWESDARCPKGHRPSYNTSSRYRPRERLPKNPAPKNPGRKKESRPMARPPLHPALSPLSLERPPTQIKKGSILKRRKRNGTGKTISRQLGIMPTPLRLARRRNGMTEATGGAIIARRRAIFRGTALKPPKN